MICEFFKIFELEHFWGSKLIAWADIRVVLIFYWFRSFRVDVERVIEKFTQKNRNLKFSKSMPPDLSVGKQLPSTMCHHIQKGLDLLCHVVNLKLVLCCQLWNQEKNAFRKEKQILVKSLYFGPNPLVNEVILRFSAFRSYFFV